MSLLGAVLLCGCFSDVPHDNPFDPISDDFFQAGRFDGVVTTRALGPLSGARITVSLQAGSASVSRVSDTNANGRFQFDSISPGTYRLSVEKEGFVSIRDSLIVVEAEPEPISLSMNGAPLFQSYQVQTVHVSRVWPPPVDFLRFEVRAEVSDLDGIPDIHQVWMEVPAFSIIDTLQVTEQPGAFARSILESELPVNSLHDLVGQDILLHVRDRIGDRASTSPINVTRIITQTPLVNTPQAGAVLSDPQPQLSWVCTSVPFNHSYRIEVVRIDDIVRNTVFQQGNLVPSEVCIEGEGLFDVASPLSTGSYFWTVSIVDEFGNWSRSREAGFVVI